jgi:hypothetical protein
MRLLRPRRMSTTTLAILATIVLALFGTAAGTSQAHAENTGTIYYYADGVIAGTASNPGLAGCLDGSYADCDNVGCDYGDFCAWSQPYDAGCWMEVPSDDGPNSTGAETVWADWGTFSADHCSSTGTWSWDNESSDRVWREESEDGSGTTHCISPPPYGINEDVTPQSLRDLGEIYMSDNSADCPAS